MSYKILTIDQVKTGIEIEAVQDLMREYTAWAFSLEPGSEEAPTFQGLEIELASLPGIYAPPDGRLLLAVMDGQPAGCIAFKPLDSTTCELKRLYVRPAFRGLHLGWQLVDRLIAEARRSGYLLMTLNSHISMKQAHAIYLAAGFKVVPAPADFPDMFRPKVVFMELSLADARE